IVCFIGFVLSAAVVRYVLKMPAIYSADTLVVVDSPKVSERYVAATVSADVQDRIANLTSLSTRILTNTRLWKVIEEFNLYWYDRKTANPADILKRMRADLHITLEDRGWTGSRPGAFRVTFEGRDP